MFNSNVLRRAATDPFPRQQLQNKPWLDIIEGRKNTKSKQSLTRRSSRTGCSTGSSKRDMKRQLGNLKVTLDKQETQLKTLRDARWKTISFLTDMAIATKLGGRTGPNADTFMNFYDKKFKLVLGNIPAQRDRSTQTARVQDGGIQDLELWGELGLANALRLAAVKTDERHLDRDVIDFTEIGMGSARKYRLMGVTQK